jgi:hypothetical protein
MATHRLYSNKNINQKRLQRKMLKPFAIDKLSLGTLWDSLFAWPLLLSQAKNAENAPLFNFLPS